MEIFNVGPLELIFIIVIALIIFGPQDLVKYSRKAGRWIYKASKSEFWQSVVGTSKEIKEFPRQIMKEAQIEENLNALKSLNQSIDLLPEQKPKAPPAIDEATEKKAEPPDDAQPPQ